MKATELRIGNWVETITGVYYVARIEPQTVWISPFISKDLYHHNIENINPIPLTPKWLEGAGFEVKENQSCILRITPLDVWIIIDRGNGFANEGVALFCHGIAPMYSVECRYVHQLQNLYFALTGEELEFNG